MIIIQPKVGHRNGNSSAKTATQGLGFEIHVGTKRIAASCTDLAGDEYRDQLSRRCSLSKHQPQVMVGDLLAWPDDQRWRLFKMLSDLNRPCSLQFGRDATVCTDMLGAVLDLAEAGDTIDRLERVKRAAVEAAALCYPSAPELVSGRICDRLRQAGFKGLLPQSVKRDILALLGRDKQERSAADAAQRFHNNLRQLQDLDADMPAIRYYQADFFTWRGNRWQRVEDARFEAQITSALQRDPDYCNPTKRFVGDVIANLKGQTLVDRWDTPMPLWIPRDSTKVVQSPYMAFANGLINIKKAVGKNTEPVLRKLNPRHFSEVALPFSFDPNAKCPLWDQTIAEILPKLADDDHRISVLQEILGWTLMAGDMRFEKFVLMVGAGGNGKSTILRTWKALLGEENVSHVSIDHLSSEFRLIDMAGKLANMSFDMNYVDKVAEGLLKQLVSGDPVQVNRKHKPPVTMTPSAKMIFACNLLPQFSDRTEGIWRRVLTMPFLETFLEEEADEERCKRLHKELPGILNFALAGARRLNRQGGFTHCSICTGAAKKHRTHSDPFLQFIAEKTRFRKKALPVSQAKLYSEYRDFCEKNGRKPKNSSDFHEQVIGLSGVALTRPGSGPHRQRCYSGIVFDC